MKRLQAIVAAVAVVMATGGAWAAEQVKLDGVHLCCGGCVTGVEKAVAGIDVKAACDRQAGTVTLSGSAAAVQKAMAALFDAGYYGTPDNAELKMKDASKPLKDKKLDRLELTNMHICCGACVKGINKALAGVEGVKANTAAKNAKVVVIEGSGFDGAAVIVALNKAGYAAKPKSAVRTR
jgi:copper chaperone CopZ